jgi:seryl-tRNA synthetase
MNLLRWGQCGDDRGLYRMYQFSKLEMIVINWPEDSDILHEKLISIEEELYSSLGLHYK